MVQRASRTAGSRQRRKACDPSSIIIAPCTLGRCLQARKCGLAGKAILVGFRGSDRPHDLDLKRIAGVWHPSTRVSHAGAREGQEGAVGDQGAADRRGCHGVQHIFDRAPQLVVRIHRASMSWGAAMALPASVRRPEVQCVWGAAMALPVVHQLLAARTWHRR
jgi:hypothetical protein